MHEKNYIYMFNTWLQFSLIYKSICIYNLFFSSVHWIEKKQANTLQIQKDMFEEETISKIQSDL